MTSNRIKPIATGIVVAGEDNDCLIRALANYDALVKGVDTIDAYNKHHAALKKLGREDCKGTRGYAMMRHMNALGMKMIYCGTATKAGLYFAAFSNMSDAERNLLKKQKQLKLQGVKREFMEGTYIVVTTNHATCLHNGALFDVYENGKMQNVSAVFCILN